MVPVDAEVLDDTFTPEENYAMIKMGREQIIKNRDLHYSNMPILSGNSMRKYITREIREKNRHKYRERLQELEKQIEMMKRELQKYGVIFMPVSGK